MYICLKHYYYYFFACSLAPPPHTFIATNRILFGFFVVQFVIVVIILHICFCVRLLFDLKFYRRRCCHHHHRHRRRKHTIRTWWRKKRFDWAIASTYPIACMTFAKAVGWPNVHKIKNVSHPSTINSDGSNWPSIFCTISMLKMLR